MCASHDSHACECCADELQRRAVRAAEDDRDVELAARHVEHLRRGVHDLVEREQREVPRHELDDRPQPDHRRADADAGEAELGDRRVDDAHLAELLEQPLRDLVGALVDGDFLAHEEDAVVALHLLAQRLVQRVAIRDDWHVVGTPRRVGVGVARRVHVDVFVQRLERRLRDSRRRSPTRPATTALISSSIFWSSSSVSSPCSMHVRAQQHDRDRASCTPRAPPSCGTCRYGVGHRVAHEAIGAHLEQRRRAAPCARARPPRCTASRTANTSCPSH